MRKPEVHPKVVNGKTLFRNLTLQIFKFCLGKLTNKMFAISCKVMFSILFVSFKANKTVSKLALHHIGKMFKIR